MEKNTLRKKIEDTKAEYTKRYGRLDWRYTDEGLPWAIQDYHGSVGSVMDFTENDWLACKENGWTLDEVCKLSAASVRMWTIWSCTSKQYAMMTVRPELTTSFWSCAGRMRLPWWKISTSGVRSCFRKCWQYTRATNKLEE